ncbi:unnamed protein product [Parnassius apollo]|uniref:(apollo) hypothetical protein n=1 Tax=Parnassius apollo TaxID=110799 RepID=A0A8S3W9R1_PARAO|nr:unnamed protein product [Parnassius apollo]
MLLSSDTIKGLKDSGFYKPSPIQLHGIPLGKCGFDLLLEAKSGTGKTAVFSVIALEKLDLSKGLQVVILAPTREIAMQICDVLKQIGASYKGLCVEVVMGGLSVKDDIEKFTKNVHIVVGSPGRLKHLIHDKYIDTSAVRLLVLDEADKLMEKSFQTDINYIHLALPKQKQVIMSSATYPEMSKTFIMKFLQNAQHVCPNSSGILLGIEQKITLVKYNSNIVRQTQHKFEELLKILSNRHFKQCLIFCNYQARVVEICKMLKREKWPAEQLYGQQDQTDRLDALKTLQEYKCRLLISTDLAARGIDASNVDLVINFEVPFDWQTYLHRIGRAGRYGSYGTAVSILSEGIEKNRFIKLLESAKLPFNLTHYWTNVKFCLNDDISHNYISADKNMCSVEENVSKQNVKQNCVELWNILTGDNQRTNNFESFENICKSFNEIETGKNIEPFSDLLQSFGTNQLNTIYEDYKLNQLNLLQPLHNHDVKYIDACNINDKYHNYKTEYSVSKNNDSNTNSMESKKGTILNKDTNYTSSDKNPYRDKTLNEIYTKNDSNLKTVENNSTITLINDSKYVNNKRTVVAKSNNLDEYENMCNSLASFGLPTSFSSSKNRKNSINEFVMDLKNTQRVHYQSDKCYNNRKGMNSVEESFKTTIKGTVPKQLSKDVKYRRELSKNNKKLLEHTNHLNMPQSQSTCHMNKVKRGKKYCNNSNLDEEFYNIQKYNDWYNKLKLRTKQVEIVVYLEEIRFSHGKYLRLSADCSHNSFKTDYCFIKYMETRKLQTKRLTDRIVYCLQELLSDQSD